MFSYFLVQFSIMIQANYLYTCNLMYLQMFLNRKNLFLSHRFPPDTVLRICTVAYHFLLFRCHCLRRTHRRPAVIWAALFARNLIALDTVFSPWYKPLYTGPSRISPFISLRSTHISSSRIPFTRINSYPISRIACASSSCTRASRTDLA